MFEDEVTKTWIQQTHDFVDHGNREAAKIFQKAAENWSKANDRDKIPVPVAPTARRAVINLEANPPVVFEDTGMPVSTLDPRSLVPPLMSDVGALGGDVGAPMRNELGQVISGQWQRSSTCQKWPGQTTTQNGKTFVLIAEGFAGARRYWQEIK